MPSCSVKGCKNYDTKIKKTHGISYHRFPNDPVVKERWCILIRKQRNDPYFKPHNNSRVCSAHFDEKDVTTSKGGLRKLKATALPRLEFQATKSENVQPRPSTPVQNLKPEEIIIDVNISDLDPIFDTPKEVQLKTRIEKFEKRHIIQAKKIKLLQKQNARLKKKNQSMSQIIKHFQQKKSLTSPTEQSTN